MIDLIRRAKVGKKVKIIGQTQKELA